VLAGLIPSLNEGVEDTQPCRPLVRHAARSGTDSACAGEQAGASVIGGHEVVGVRAGRRRRDRRRFATSTAATSDGFERSISSVPRRAQQGARVAGSSSSMAAVCSPTPSRSTSTRRSRRTSSARR
jgi:hypothetical protein